MPISDGFVTCKNILKKYDYDQIFKSKNLNLNLKPMIIACTSDLIDEPLKRLLKAVGFDMMFEAPITDAQIKNQILPTLKERFKQEKR